jgi:hypothetical protein
MAGIVFIPFHILKHRDFVKVCSPARCKDGFIPLVMRHGFGSARWNSSFWQRSCKIIYNSTEPYETRTKRCRIRMRPLRGYETCMRRGMKLVRGGGAWNPAWLLHGGFPGSGGAAFVCLQISHRFPHMFGNAQKSVAVRPCRLLTRSCVHLRLFDLGLIVLFKIVPRGFLGPLGTKCAYGYNIFRFGAFPGIEKGGPNRPQGAHKSARGPPDLSGGVWGSSWGPRAVWGPISGYVGVDFGTLLVQCLGHLGQI